jgi:hypothetical protein
MDSAEEGAGALASLRPARLRLVELSRVVAAIDVTFNSFIFDDINFNK